MRSFLQLLRKELFTLRWYIVPLAGLSVLWHLFLMTRIGLWDEGIILGLGTIPFGFIPMWILITSFITYRNEWNEDTIYFMLALPINAWKVTLTKLLSVVIGAVVGTVVIGLGFLGLFGIISEGIIGNYLNLVPNGWIAYNGMLAVIFGFASLVAGIMILQASYIVSRMANRLHGVVLLWIFFLVSWLIPRLSMLIEPLLRWLPSIKIIGGSISNGVFATQNIWIPLGPILAPFLVTLGFFALATWLWQSQIELA